MPFDSDHEYYRMREADERLASTTATNPATAEIHLVLAERYADLLRSLQAQSDKPKN